MYIAIAILYDLPYTKFRLSCAMQFSQSVPCDDVLLATELPTHGKSRPLTAVSILERVLIRP